LGLLDGLGSMGTTDDLNGAGDLQHRRAVFRRRQSREAIAREKRLHDSLGAILPTAPARDGRQERRDAALGHLMVDLLLVAGAGADRIPAGINRNRRALRSSSLTAQDKPEIAGRSPRREGFQDAWLPPPSKAGGVARKSGIVLPNLSQTSAARSW